MHAIMILSVYTPSELRAVLCCVMTTRTIHRKIKLCFLPDITMLLSVSYKLVDRSLRTSGRKNKFKQILVQALLCEENLCVSFRQLSFILSTAAYTVI